MNDRDGIEYRRAAAIELLALRRRFHEEHYLDEPTTQRMDELIILLAKPLLCQTSPTTYGVLETPEERG